MGLAIVKRLAELMGAPLTVRSVPGRGTIFMVDLAAGKPPPVASSSVPALAQARLTLDGTLIVVVEDKPAVRSGLQVLLEGWGAQVAGFESYAATAQWASEHGPGAAPPQLLIVDYQREAGRTGVEAINALRADLGKAVPAIVVTGSRISGLEAEAERGDCHLLMKPVAPGRLRAMIGFKLGAR